MYINIIFYLLKEQFYWYEQTPNKIFFSHSNGVISDKIDITERLIGDLNLIQ